MIHFSDQFQKISVEDFKISRSHAENVIQNKDHVEFIKLDDNAQLTFFCKKIVAGEKEFCLVVCTMGSLDNLTVVMAYKILPEMYKEIKEITPLRLLRELAIMFGLNITIGDVTSKFILREQIRCNTVGPTNIFMVDNPLNHSFFQNFHYKIEQDRLSYVAHCALCFCIDTTIYKKWINR